MTKYDNTAVRRQDRLLDESRAWELLAGGEYGYLSLVDAKDAYGIPMNYVWNEDHIYFHCAPQGRKLRIIEANDSASLCVVGPTFVESAGFTTSYESIVVSGRIEIVTDDGQRMKALELLVDKYSPDHKDQGKKYAEKSFGRTALLRLRVETVSGKCKEIKKLRMLDNYK